MRSSAPATFNMAVLFDIINANKSDAFRLLKFLKEKNIRDYRICADESTNKGHSFCDIDFDLVHYLFDCINFHQVFSTTDENEIIRFKIDVYNNVVAHFKLDLMEECQDTRIKSTKEYGSKLSNYLKIAVARSVSLHRAMDEYGTRVEGVENFWYVVDHYIFINKVKHELNSLKSLRANAD